MVCLYWAELLRAITSRPGMRGELAAHLVCDAVGEVLVLGTAEVLEGEHREPLGTGSPGFGPGAQPGE